MNDEIITIHPELFDEYITFLENTFSMMQESQNNVEKFFVKLGYTWHDTVYNFTGDCLVNIAMLLKRGFDSARVAIISTIDYYNNWLTIQKLPKYCRSKTIIGEFYSILKEGEYKMDTYKERNVSSLPDMKNFINELENYINITVDSIVAIQRQHDDVGEREIWVSKQYYQLGEALQSIQQEIKKQLNNLNDARDELINVYLDIENINSTNIRKY